MESAESFIFDGFNKKPSLPRPTQNGSVLDSEGGVAVPTYGHKQPRANANK